VSADHAYFVYTMASRSRTLYTGVTNDLERRILQHRQGEIPGFTAKYKTHRLVYFELSPTSGMPSGARKRSKAGGGKRRSA